MTLFRNRPERQFLEILKQEVLGRCVIVEHPEGKPVIHIGSDFKILVESQWRLLGAHRILVTDTDHDQWFGLSAPIDAAAKAIERLANRIVESVEFNGVTGDLRLHFSNSLVLEILTNSAGYESWTMFLREELFAVGASGGLV